MIPTHETLFLVRKARLGCRRSFARLWNANADRLRHLLGRLLPSPMVDDVLQDVAVAAIVGIRALRDSSESGFGAWLQAIARKRAMSALASHRRRREVAEEEDVVDGSSEVEPFETLVQRELQEALRQLPRCYRVPVRLRYLRGLSGPEVARRMGMTHGSVRVSLCRALRLLRSGLPSAARIAGS